MYIPTALELLSAFGTEPELLDTVTESLPFEYNQATYRFSNEREGFCVIIFPASDQFQLTVTDLVNQEVVILFDLQRVDKLEILADNKERMALLLTLIHDDIMQTLHLEFKPRFKSFFKENLNH